MENNVIRKFGVSKTAKTAKIILILFGCLVTFCGALLFALEQEQQMLGIFYIVIGVIGVTGAQFLSKRYICICESKLYGDLGSFANKNQVVEINYSEIISAKTASRDSVVIETVKGTYRFVMIDKSKKCVELILEQMNKVQ